MEDFALSKALIMNARAVHYKQFRDEKINIGM